MAIFERIVGINYSGAKTPTESLPALRVFASDGLAAPAEIAPPASPKKYWTRKGVAHWLVEQLGLVDGPRTLVGIDHAFSFPLRYFEAHRIAPDWSVFLDDFQRHWPTDDDHLYVDFVRDGLHGSGRARGGHARWRRLTDDRAAAKSVFQFDVPGQVAKSTHAGIPWLRFLRQQLGERVQFWPFDGWALTGRSTIAEVYPSLWNRGFAREFRTEDQHDAFSIVEWLGRSDRAGQLAPVFRPDLSDAERAVAAVEGWILGVA